MPYLSTKVLKETGLGRKHHKADLVDHHRNYPRKKDPKLQNTKNRQMSKAPRRQAGRRDDLLKRRLSSAPEWSLQEQSPVKDSALFR